MEVKVKLQECHLKRIVGLKKHKMMIKIKLVIIEWVILLLFSPNTQVICQKFHITHKMYLRHQQHHTYQQTVTPIISTNNLLPNPNHPYLAQNQPHPLPIAATMAVPSRHAHHQHHHHLNNNLNLSNNLYQIQQIRLTLQWVKKIWKFWKRSKSLEYKHQNKKNIVNFKKKIKSC